MYDNVIAADPTNANHAVAGGIALVETTNGGTSWRNVNGQTFSAATSPTRPTRPNRRCSTGDRTTNPSAGSPTWTAVTSVGAFVSALAASPSNPSVVYAGFTDGTMQVSTDGGVAFSSLAFEPFNDHFVTGTPSTRPIPSG